jgi:2-haloacid dehalogenase
MCVVAFDVYGTVVDPAGMVDQLRKRFGTRASTAAQLWREKQLEYSFRRALMRRYVDLDACTAQALRYVGTQLGVHLDESDQHALLDSYLRLPTFPDVKIGLETLRGAGYKLVALTNGTERSVRSLLQHAGISECFDMILSADTIETFKPDPAVYALLQRAGEITDDKSWLVSGNPFDVIGAKAYGLKAAWVRRGAAKVFDPWEFSPDVVVQTLEELCGELQNCHSRVDPPIVG